VFKGVNHVGIGVSDMDKSLKFYGDLLGFTEVMFDYTGPLPGMERVTGKPEIKARVVMLENQNTAPVGLGMIKLVQLLPPDKPGPIPDGTYWGEIGVAEIAVSTRGVPEKFSELVLKGAKALMPPSSGCFPPYDTSGSFAYVADPDGGKVELMDWSEMCPGLGTEPKTAGLNHVAFGVSDMDKSLKLYRELGFTELIFDYNGYIDGMAIWFPEPVRMRLIMMANYYGATIEPCQHFPPSKDLRGSWGHLGPMEFAVGISNLDKAYEELQRKGIKFLSPPQTVEVSSGQWKYAYVVEPDNLYVSLIEPRY